jgi:hypothetical protein
VKKTVGCGKDSAADLSLIRSARGQIESIFQAL